MFPKDPDFGAKCVLFRRGGCELGALDARGRSVIHICAELGKAEELAYFASSKSKKGAVLGFDQPDLEGMFS